MIARIQSDAEIKALIHKYREKGNCYARLSLDTDSIQQWIQEGKFKRLKDEVNIYNNVQFGCLKDDFGCQYYFFGNKKAVNRILNLMVAILDGVPGHLTDFDANPSWRLSKRHLYDTTRGEFNACLLF